MSSQSQQQLQQEQQTLTMTPPVSGGSTAENAINKHKKKKKQKETTNTTEHSSNSSRSSCDSFPTAVKASDTEEEEEDIDHYDDDELSVVQDTMLELGIMFEGGQPTRREYFQWEIPYQNSKRIEVVLDAADDDPGAVQSGHYLWPAATLLAEYLVQHYNNYKDDDDSSFNPSSSSPLQQQQHRPPLPVAVVELGAGCALCSWTAWQLWATSLQCLIVTDHDPGTLERARANQETTLEALLDQESLTEDDFNSTINTLGSIPTQFECLEWGQNIETIQDILAERTVPSQRHVNYILGSDLIYDQAVVEPLFRTAQQLLWIEPGRRVVVDPNNHSDSWSRRSSTSHNTGVPTTMRRSSSSTTSTTGGGGGGGDGNHGRFLLSQSFTYDDATEEEIQRCCQELGLVRTILWEKDEGKQRIQEFYLAY